MLEWKWSSHLVILCYSFSSQPSTEFPPNLQNSLDLILGLASLEAKTKFSSLDPSLEPCLPVNRTHSYDQGLSYFAIVVYFAREFLCSHTWSSVIRTVTWRLSHHSSTVFKCVRQLKHGTRIRLWMFFNSLTDQVRPYWIFILTSLRFMSLLSVILQGPLHHPISWLAVKHFRFDPTQLCKRSFSGWWETHLELEPEPDTCSHFLPACLVTY